MMRFDTGDENKTCYCRYCKQWVTRKECRGIACVRCYEMLTAIQQHNNERQGKGLKFKNDLWQFSGHVFRKRARDNSWMAFHNRQYDKIFIDLKAFEKNGIMNIESLVNALQHEFMHYLLFKQEGRRATSMWDFPNIRLTMDSGGYLGFVEIMPGSYYTSLFNKSVIMKKALDELDKENEI